MNDFYERLDALYAAGDKAAIETLLRSAASEAGERTLKRAGILNELAGFYRGVSSYSESKEAFEEALDIFALNGMVASTEYATVLLNLAGLYRLCNETDKSIELFLSAKKSLEDSGASDSYAYVSILNNLALALHSKGDSAHALEYATKALDKMREGSGKEHEIATSLNNIASINLQLGKHEDAEKQISEALGIYEAMQEPDVHHAAAITTAAVLKVKRGGFNDALIDFRHALDLTTRFFGENIEYALCKRNIADVCELMGDVPSAIEELTDALKVMEKLLGSEHDSTKATLAKLMSLERGLAL